MWLWNAPKYEITLPTGSRIILDGSKSRAEANEFLDDQIKHEASNRPGAKIEPGTRDEVLNSIYGGYASPGERAREAWFAAVLPPIGLFIIGLAVGWIFTGFRKA